MVVILKFCLLVIGDVLVLLEKQVRAGVLARRHSVVRVFVSLVLEGSGFDRNELVGR